MDAYLWLFLVSVFTAGLLSGVHCVGMCGGIVAAVAAQLPEGRRLWPYHLAYNGGRILSYAAAGAAVGAIGQGGLALKSVAPQVQQTLFALASVMLIAMGAYLAGMGRGVRWLEKAGGVIWEKIQPWAQHMLPVNSLPKALGLGVLWGWLPCGLVYTMLLTALAMGSAVHGALVMLAFGAGTLPNLLAVGLFYDAVRKFIRARPVRLGAGLLVAGMGVYGLFRLWTGIGFSGQCLFCHGA